MKRKFAAVLAAAMLFITIPAQARGVPGDFLSYAKQSAERLYNLGLFFGTGQNPDGSPNFDLTSPATRGEAVTMLVRMLGAEDEAKISYYGHPFTDVGWAEDYIDYAYGNHIAYGISDTEFGTQYEVTLPQFLTFTLRALGYTDIDWQNPYPLADEVGLIYADGDCYRADMAIICSSALECMVCGSNKTLFETLSEKGAIGSSAAPAEGFGPVTEPVTSISISSGDELMEKFAEVVNGRAPQVTINVPAGTESFYIDELNSEINRFCDLYRLGSTWIPGSGVITVNITYDTAVTAMAYLEGKISDIDDNTRLTLNEAIRVHSRLVSDNMTPYDKVKAFHDYLVNFNTYQETGSRSHSAVGALLDGLSVCEGYTEALDLLCYLSNIDCVQVSGTGFSNGTSESHSWNKVYIDDAWYNVDVTWDDPVSFMPVLRYDYFLISDSELSKDHQWYLYPHWPVSESSYSNYF